MFTLLHCSLPPFLPYLLHSSLCTPALHFTPPLNSGKFFSCRRKASSLCQIYQCIWQAESAQLSFIPWAKYRGLSSIDLIQRKYPSTVYTSAFLPQDLRLCLETISNDHIDLQTVHPNKDSCNHGHGFVRSFGKEVCGVRITDIAIGIAAEDCAGPASASLNFIFSRVLEFDVDKLCTYFTIQREVALPPPMVLNGRQDLELQWHRPHGFDGKTICKRAQRDLLRCQKILNNLSCFLLNRPIHPPSPLFMSVDREHI